MTKTKLKSHLRTLDEVASGYLIPLGAPTQRELAGESAEHLRALRKRNTTISSINRRVSTDAREKLDMIAKLQREVEKYRNLETEFQQQERAWGRISVHVEAEDRERYAEQSFVDLIIGALDELKARREDSRNESRAAHPAGGVKPEPGKFALPQAPNTPGSRCRNCGHATAWSERTGSYYHHDSGQRLCNPFSRPMKREGKVVGFIENGESDQEAADRWQRADEDGDLQDTTPDVDPQLTNTLKFLANEYGPTGVDKEFGRLFPTRRAARGQSIVKTSIQLAKATGGNAALIKRLLLETTDVWEENQQLKQQLMTDEQAPGQGMPF